MLAGITGHQRVARPKATWPWIASEFHRLLTEYRVEIGASSLAEGSDQVFASAVLALGKDLLAVIPFAGYETRFASERGRRGYHDLLARADRVEVLSPPETDEIGYLNAGKRIVDISDILFAVWNGQPARGIGGTADIVQYAVLRGIRIVHLNPETATVTFVGGSS